MAEQSGNGGFGAKAGRFVRAAGAGASTAAKEFEKANAEKRARLAAEAAHAAATAPAPPPMTEVPLMQPAAPQQAAAPAPAPSSRRRRPMQRPDPGPNVVIDSVLYGVFVISVVAGVLMAIQINSILPRDADFVLAAIFLSIGWLLTTDRWQARRRIVLRMARGRRHDGRPVGWRYIVDKVGRELLTLVGIVWVALGLWVLAQAAIGGSL